jgi:hypothetical protein
VLSRRAARERLARGKFLFQEERAGRPRSDPSGFVILVDNSLEE